MIDTIAYQIGSTKFVQIDEPDFIACMAENLRLAECPCKTADRYELNDLSELFRGLA